jgi:mannose/fructose/N-acetylgalactosamine-specific phosphotransferase system component IIB
MQSSRVISLLRSIQDLSHLDNQVIMQINDIGYAAIQQTQLKKMLDKRALVNEERMAKMDAEVDEILEKINIEELRKKH